MDYFNSTEREQQIKFAAFRDRIAASLVQFFIKIQATPNQITYLGILFLIIACVFNSPVIVAIFLMLYVGADAMDGPLARAYGKSHKGGSIMDIYADQLGVVFLPAAAIYHLGTNGTSVVLFSCGYLIFIVLVVYSNELKIAVGKFIRVKYPMYFLYGFCLIINEEWMNDLMSYFFLVFGAYYWVKITFQLKIIYDFHDSASGSEG